MLVGRVIDDQVDDDANAALLRLVSELDEIAERAVARVHRVIVGHIVAVIAVRGFLEGHQPDRGDAEPLQVIEPAHEAFEIADAVAVGIHVACRRTGSR